MLDTHIAPTERSELLDGEREMDFSPLIDPNWIVALIAAAAAIISAWYSVVRIGIRPKITVRPFEADQATCEEGQEVTLHLEFENTGRAGIVRRDTLHGISVAIYFPANYNLVEIERQDTKHSRTFKAPQKGRFSGMHYTYVPDPFDRKPPVIGSLCHNEVEECTLKIVPNNIPPQGHEILFDINAKQGEVLANSIRIKKKC